MKLEVHYIDAWKDPDGQWTYNETFPLCDVSVNGEPTTRKILKALREKELISNKSIYQVDDYFNYEGSWEVQLIRDWRPLFVLKEKKEK